MVAKERDNHKRKTAYVVVCREGNKYCLQRIGVECRATGPTEYIDQGLKRGDIDHLANSMIGQTNHGTGLYRHAYPII